MVRPPPLVLGWWDCCSCGNRNNPALTIGRCTSCGHSQCTTCRLCRDPETRPGGASLPQAGTSSGVGRRSNSRSGTKSETKPETGSDPSGDLFLRAQRLQRGYSSRVRRKAQDFEESVFKDVLCEDELIVACIQAPYHTPPGRFPPSVLDVSARLAELLSAFRRHLQVDPFLDEASRLHVLRHISPDLERVSSDVQLEIMEGWMPKAGAVFLRKDEGKKSTGQRSKELSRSGAANRLRDLLLSTEAYWSFRKELLACSFPSLGERLRAVYKSPPPSSDFDFEVVREIWAKIIKELRCVQPNDIYFHDPPPTGWINSCQGRIESWSGVKWDWWPLKPYTKPLEKDERVVSWPCPNCGDTRCIRLPASFVDYLEDFVADQVKVTSRVQGFRRSLAQGPVQSSAGRDAEAQTPGSNTELKRPSGSSDIDSMMSAGPSSQINAQHRMQPSASSSGLQQGSVPMTAAVGSTAIVTSTERYVLLIVRRSSRYLLSQIAVRQLNDDRFFHSLRVDYYRMRGWLRNLFSVWRYSHCDFYQFDKFDDSAYAPKVRDCYPKSKDHYEYNPDPMDVVPPISEHEFYCRFYSCCKHNDWSVHLFHSCRKATGQSCGALDLLPKKKVRMEENGDERLAFWCIYAQEIVCFRWVVAYNVVCLLPMIIFIFLWLFPLGYRGDLQNAAVPFTAVIGMLTIFWSFFIGNIRFGGSR